MAKALNTIAVLPLGAYEYHGPHLPYETDSLIIEGFCKKLKPLLPKELNVEFLPTQTIGYSIEHQAKRQTRSLSYQEALQNWINIGKSCAEKGIKKLILFNAHGGNSPLLSIVATELRAQYDMLTVKASWRHFGLPEKLHYQGNPSHDIHGGFLETSLILALAPQKVLMEKAENFSNQQAWFEQNYHHLRGYGSIHFGWMMPDLNDKGACGCANKASASIGNMVLDHVAEQFLLLLEDVRKFPLSALKENFTS